MAAPTSAIAPASVVTEVPGRFAPLLVVDKRNPATITTSTVTSAQLAYLTRAESATEDLNVPLTDVDEVGTNLNVGNFDDIADNKLSINAYDVSCYNLSLLTGKDYPTGSTTTYTFNDLNVANVDVIRQYAAPGGQVFQCEFFSNHVIEEYGITLKAKAAAMEMYTLVGFNTAVFRGAIQTKAYVVQAADVTAKVFQVPLGTNEAFYALPSDGSGPASYWLQNGHIYCLKIERYRAATGFTQYTETSGAGGVVSGSVCYTQPAGTIAFATGDLVAGDLFFITYATYASNVTALSPRSAITAATNVDLPYGSGSYAGFSYMNIPQLTTNAAGPVAVPTRLTPITISAANVPRGQSGDWKLTLKRDRAEGIGDVNGIYGPSDAPSVALSLEVKKTDMALDTLLEYGTANGSDAGGPVANDFVDPTKAVRNALTTAVPFVGKLYDPRSASTCVKTITSPNAVFPQRSISTPNKGMATVKYTGKDVIGNLMVSVTR